MNRPWIRQYQPGVPGTLSYPDISLPELLAQSAAKFPAQPALRYYGRVIRYRELDLLANRFANLLLRLGAGPGHTVGLMLPNLPQTVIAFYGSLRAGSVVTPINPLSVEAEIAQQASDAGCDTLVALDQSAQRLEPLLRRGVVRRLILTGVEEYLPGLKRLLFPLKAVRQTRRVRIPTGPAVLPFLDVLAEASSPPGVPVKPHDTALLQYTGGTTGIPKGVVLTHRNLICNVWQCRSWMPSLSEGREVFLAVLPFFHVYGMSACQNLAISIGGSLALLPRFQIVDVLETLARERVTVFPGIPAMYAAINGHQHLDRYNLRAVRICISGAGPLDPTIQERFESLTGASLVEGYGLTEAGPVTHINPLQPGEGGRRQRSIGLPIADTDAKIMDADTGERELPIGEVGELAVHGPQIMQGYWKQPEETANVLRNGWLYTGDLARCDADGYFYIVDRKKDMIKSGGENVYPREVEETLCRCPKVKEAVVVGIPRGLRGELIKAFVVLQDGATATPAEILEYCRKNLARFKVPKRVEFRAELPKTVVGKYLRRVLVEEELKKHQGQEGAGDGAGED